MEEDTIIAQCTPTGVGAIAVIRLSGVKSWLIARQLVLDYSGKPFLDVLDRKLYLCKLNIKNITDKAMIVKFVAPNSYTGEEVVEIQLHGNAILSRLIISQAILLGARIAEGGEFTRRALLNNKIDLSEAEGIFGVINATAESELRAAAESSDGKLYKIIEEIFDGLIDLGASAESAIDYPEEDLEEITKKQIYDNLLILKSKLINLVNNFDSGKVLRDGALIVIAGETNVGKSTLLNSIIGYDRAIVSDEAGTTRDTLTESYIYKGIKFNICDTAGIRQTTNKIEELGIERSTKQIERADIVIALAEVGKKFDIPLPKNKKIIYVYNKSDKIESVINEKDDNNLTLSALYNKNVDKLKEMIYNEVMQDVSCDGVGLNNFRQQQACLESLSAINRALDNINILTIDCIACDIKSAATSLGKITGKTASEEIINQIFAKFCVGK